MSEIPRIAAAMPISVPIATIAGFWARIDEQCNGS